jgi:hypothetical protein
MRAYRVTSETDTLLGVKNRALPNKALHTTGTTVGLVKSNLADDLATMLSVNNRSLD